MTTPCITDDKHAVVCLANRALAPAIARVCTEAIDAIDVGPFRAAVERLALDPDFSYLPPGSPLANRPELAVSYFIFESALQFCFWELGIDGSVQRYQRRGQVGSFAMMSALHGEFVRALSAGNAWDAPYPAQLQAIRSHFFGGLAGLTLSGIRTIFGPIPMPAARVTILRELLADNDNFADMVHCLVESAKYGCFCEVQAKMLVQHFPLSFRDPYLKKAQLALACIGHTLKASTELFEISAPADYQLPRVLRRLGFIEYGARLAEVVDNGRLIQSGDVYESAIRAATTMAVYALGVKAGCATVDLDRWLWSQRNACAQDKFHLCITTHY